MHQLSPGSKQNSQLTTELEQQNGRATLTPRETTAITGFGIQQTYKMLRANKLPHIRCGTRFFIPRAALMRWLESCGTAAPLGVSQF